MAFAAAGSARELPLPAVPDSLRSEMERADWLAGHFWDGMDFNARAVAADSAMIEQAFATFASVLPHCTSNARNEAVQALMKRADRHLLWELAEKYLYEPQSPVYDEESFVPFARFVAAANDNADDASRASALLNELRAGEPGILLPDFDITVANGSTATLYDLTGGAPALLLFFDPYCDVCHHVMEQIAADAAFSAAVASGRIRYVAIDRTRSNPPEWLPLRATPTLLLIDPSRRILRRGFTLPTLAPRLRPLL